MTGPTIGPAFVAVIGLAHVGFGVLEMFFWDRPLGRRVFRTDADFARKSQRLAANQGLYNYFLAAGLLVTFFLDPVSAHTFRYFFLLCVAVAGLYGGYTVNSKIYFAQAAPAFAALFFLALGL
jgi:putative membrane protein